MRCKTHSPISVNASNHDNQREQQNEPMTFRWWRKVQRGKIGASTLASSVWLVAKMARFFSANHKAKFKKKLNILLPWSNLSHSKCHLTSHSYINAILNSDISLAFQNDYQSVYCTFPALGNHVVVWLAEFFSSWSCNAISVHNIQLYSGRLIWWNFHDKLWNILFFLFLFSSSVIKIWPNITFARVQ